MTLNAGGGATSTNLSDGALRGHSSRFHAARTLVLVPTRASARAVGMSTRASARVVRVSTRLTYRSIRLAVRSTLIAFVTGIGVGWFLTTPTGRLLIAYLRDLLAPEPVAPPDDDSLAAAVRTELASATTTWHLAQPDVGVVAGRITLAGPVAHVAGREALLRVAAGVPGVQSVVDQLVLPVAGAADGGPDGSPVR